MHVGFDHNRFQAQAVTVQAVREFLFPQVTVPGLADTLEGAQIGALL